MHALLAATILISQGHERKVFREFIVPSPDRWIQKPTTLKALHGKVVLLDYFDYTCNNCIRTHPYLKEWYRRYHNKGFEIVSIHTPEFDFEKDPAKVRAAVKRFGFTWPVLNDPKQENWWEEAVFAWPTKIVLDGNGHRVFFRIGEGNYGLFEKVIQDQLRSLHPGINLPPLMEPVRPTDKPGAVCRPVTREIYTWIKGFPRNQLSFPPSDIGKTVHYVYPKTKSEGIVYLQGTWSPQKHFLEPNSPDARLEVKYMAKEVNVVLTTRNPVSIQVFQDGKPLQASDFGSDVHVIHGVPTVVASEPRMYSIVTNKNWKHADLELRIQQPGVQIYSLSFSTDCVAGGK